MTDEEFTGQLLAALGGPKAREIAAAVVKAQSQSQSQTSAHGSHHQPGDIVCGGRYRLLELKEVGTYGPDTEVWVAYDIEDDRPIEVIQQRRP